MPGRLCHTLGLLDAAERVSCHRWGPWWQKKLSLGQGMELNNTLVTSPLDHVAWLAEKHSHVISRL